MILGRKNINFNDCRDLSFDETKKWANKKKKKKLRRSLCWRSRNQFKRQIYIRNLLS